MKTLKLAAAPVLLVVIWIAASVHTISELTTVVPTLRAADMASPAVRPQFLAHQSR
jgi:hypothetical protein